MNATKVESATVLGFNGHIKFDSKFYAAFVEKAEEAGYSLKEIPPEKKNEILDKIKLKYKDEFQFFSVDRLYLESDEEETRGWIYIFDRMPECEPWSEVTMKLPRAEELGCEFNELPEDHESKTLKVTDQMLHKYYEAHQDLHTKRLARAYKYIFEKDHDYSVYKGLSVEEKKGVLQKLMLEFGYEFMALPGDHESKTCEITNKDVERFYPSLKLAKT